MKIPSIILLFSILIGCSETSSYESNGSDTTYLESGVKYIHLMEGTGDRVEAGKKITTHINLMIAEDTVWSTHHEGETEFDFVAQKDPLIKGFDEVVMYARAGDRVLAIIPPELGYGENGSGEDIPPNSTLRFDIEILSVAYSKPYLSDTLYQALVSDGIEGLMDKFESVQYDTTNFIINNGQWRILSTRLRNEEMFDEVVALWNYRLEVVKDIGGYYQLAKGYEGLENIELAIETMERSIALDTTNNQTLVTYLEELKAK